MTLKKFFSDFLTVDGRSANPSAAARRKRWLVGLLVGGGIFSGGIEATAQQPALLYEPDAPAATTAAVAGTDALAARARLIRPGLRSTNPMQNRSRVRRPNADDAPGGLPIFKRRFTYQGAEYVERFVGTEPSQQQGTKHIRTIVVPVRLDFGGGVVRDTAQDTIFDGRTELDWVLNSPLFQPTNIFSGATLVGNTQWGDAFMRANFWTELSQRDSYHVLLQPSVRPETWVVTSSWTYFANQYNLSTLPSILYDNAWLSAQVEASAARIADPAALIMYILPPETYFGDVANQFIYADGYHESFTLPDRENGPPQTYIVSNSRGGDFNLFRSSAAVTILSHEIEEWYSDPYVDNYTPPWALYAPNVCTNYLETGDFLSDNLLGPNGGYTPLYAGGRGYGMLEGVFLDWFTRRARSRSVNGWYSLFNTAIGPSEPCATDGQQYAQTTIDFPGAARTYLQAINNSGDIVGRFRDVQGTTHGFLLSAGRFQVIDAPGAYYTAAVGINDHQQISGFFIDAIGYHGFTYAAGILTPRDYGPGFDTLLSKINNSGVVAGMAIPQDGTSPTRSVLYSNGRFRDVQVPFAYDSDAADVSDLGVVAGHFDSSVTSPTFGYLDFFGQIQRIRIPWSTSTYPESVRGVASITGWAIDQLGYASAVSAPRIGGDWRHIFVDGSYFTVLYGSNDFGSLVGYYGDGSGFHGILLTPKALQ
jgi:hypothetical protein